MNNLKLVDKLKFTFFKKLYNLILRRNENIDPIICQQVKNKDFYQ